MNDIMNDLDEGPCSTVHLEAMGASIDGSLPRVALAPSNGSAAYLALTCRDATTPQFASAVAIISTIKGRIHTGYDIVTHVAYRGPCPPTVIIHQDVFHSGVFEHVSKTTAMWEALSGGWWAAKVMGSMFCRLNIVAVPCPGLFLVHGYLTDPATRDKLQHHTPLLHSLIEGRYFTGQLPAPASFPDTVHMPARTNSVTWPLAATDTQNIVLSFINLPFPVNPIVQLTRELSDAVRHGVVGLYDHMTDMGVLWLGSSKSRDMEATWSHVPHGLDDL